MKNDMIRVQRHTPLYRILHWVIMAQVVLLIISGLGVSDYISLSALGRGFARNFHIVLAMIWTGTITFFVYYFVMSGEYKWFGLSRVGQSFDFFVHEFEHFIKGKKVKSPIRYSAAGRKYTEKVIPTEVLAWWGWFMLWSVMVLTGLALVFPENFNFINRLSLAILPGLNKGAAATRYIHLLASIGMILFAMIHAYASWTFGMIGSMISGFNKEPAAD